MKRLFVLTNVYPRPWEPNRGVYNDKLFGLLEEDFALTIFVPVKLLDVLKRPIAFFNVARDARKRWPNAKYFLYFNVPVVSQRINVEIMLLSLLIQYPLKVLFGKYDLVFSSWLYPDAVVGTLIARLHSVPTVVHAIGSDVNVLTKIPIMRKRIVNASRFWSASVVVSKDLGNKLAAIGVQPDQIKVIYNGVDSDVFACSQHARVDRPEGQNKDILFVGNLLKEKGCEELARAFEVIAATNPSTHLYFVGAGPFGNRLREICKTLQYRDRIHLIGQVLHSDLPSWYRKATIFCLPSYSEGVPNVVMEALASGLPVVATQVGGISEFVNSSNGVLVAPQSVDALVRGLREALARRWDTEVCRKAVISFTWRSMAHEYSVLLKRALNDKR